MRMRRVRLFFSDLALLQSEAQLDTLAPLTNRMIGEGRFFMRPPRNAREATYVKECIFSEDFLGLVSFYRTTKTKLKGIYLSHNVSDYRFYLARVFEHVNIEEFFLGDQKFIGFPEEL
ncbi:hypothetical protein EVAR_97824_1 [Eumeta japonica]|uniref:Uncharacterized protein n=1 Tax=Eumeta variegata TaxID=151549 RepID=A0A4C1XE20_EUMVA|nr:hypothetical protein EVAR_97824_1 [Eumeta japonica]